MADDAHYVSWRRQLRRVAGISALERFQPEVILASLIDHGVRFVLIGGLAAQAHGSPSLTG